MSIQKNSAPMKGANDDFSAFMAERLKMISRETRVLRRYLEMREKYRKEMKDLHLYDPDDRAYVRSCLMEERVWYTSRARDAYQSLKGLLDIQGPDNPSDDLLEEVAEEIVAAADEAAEEAAASAAEDEEE